jgi:anti-anti-sigma factor
MGDVSEPRLERAEPPPREGVAVLELGGELDLAVHDRFRELVDEVVADRPQLVVADVSEVEFMDSTMLREVLRAHRTLDEGGSRLVVAGAQPAVRRLLELTGTHEVLTLADTRADALS